MDEVVETAAATVSGRGGHGRDNSDQKIDRAAGVTIGTRRRMAERLLLRLSHERGDAATTEYSNALQGALTGHEPACISSLVRARRRGRKGAGS